MAKLGKTYGQTVHFYLTKYSCRRNAIVSSGGTVRERAHRGTWDELG